MSIKTSWVKIFESNNNLTVEILKTLLMEEHNIEAVVLNKQISGYNIGRIELHVLESKQVIAKAIVQEFEDQEEKRS